MDLQTHATSALAATVAAVALNRAIEWQKSAAVSRAQLRGILLELAHAEHCAERYFDSAAAPRFAALVYRIATQYLGSSIEILAANGALRRTEAEQLYRFYIEADETNRTLDALAVIAGTSTAGRGEATMIVTLRQIGTHDLARERFERLRRELPPVRAAAEAALARVAWFEHQD